jgi:hypothetical protein
MRITIVVLSLLGWVGLGHAAEGPLTKIRKAVATRQASGLSAEMNRLRDSGSRSLRVTSMVYKPGEVSRGTVAQLTRKLNRAAFVLEGLDGKVDWTSKLASKLAAIKPVLLSAPDYSGAPVNGFWRNIAVAGGQAATEGDRIRVRAYGKAYNRFAAAARKAGVPNIPDIVTHERGDTTIELPYARQINFNEPALRSFGKGGDAEDLMKAMGF